MSSVPDASPQATPIVWWELVDGRYACMYAFKSMCPPHFNMAGGGRGVKAILNEFSLPAKCELMIRSLRCGRVCTCWLDHFGKVISLSYIPDPCRCLLVSRGSCCPNGQIKHRYLIARHLSSSQASFCWRRLFLISI